MYLLKVMVMVVGSAHPALTAYIPYPTRFTCEKALDHPALAESFWGLVDTKKRKVRAVVPTCVEMNNRI